MSGPSDINPKIPQEPDKIWAAVRKQLPRADQGEFLFRPHQMERDEPVIFRQLANIPELKAKYNPFRKWKESGDNSDEQLRRNFYLDERQLQYDSRVELA
jgi:hypothetical protein